MLGELNASHLGFYPITDHLITPVQDWSRITAYFGLRFEPEYSGLGLKVNWVIHNSPADQVDSKIDKGEIILQIDGKAINSGINPAAILDVIENREVQLTIQSNQKTKRTVVIRPIRYDQARNLLYEQWVNYNQKIVEKLSNSRLGYVYIRRMDWSSFERFEKGVYETGFGKDAFTRLGISLSWFYATKIVLVMLND